MLQCGVKVLPGVLECHVSVMFPEGEPGLFPLDIEKWRAIIKR